MTIRAFESASNNSVHFYSEPSLTTNASPNAISTRYSEELLRPDRKIFKSLFTPKTPVAKLNLRDRTAITFSTDLVRTPDTQTLFEYAGGSLDNVTTTTRRNLLRYTEQFDNAVWERNAISSITPNSTTAPDGTTTADTITSSGNDPFILQLVNSTELVYTISVWLRGVGSTIGKRPALYLIGDNYTQFRSSGVLAPLTDQWQRYSYTGTFLFRPSSYVYARIDILESGGVNNDAVYAWGAQLESGIVLGSYQTVGATYTPLPHLITTQDPGAHRRNRLINTELLTGSGWNPINLTPSQVSGDTWRLTPTASTGLHYLTAIAIASNINTLTWEVKAEQLTAVYFELFNNSGVAGVAGVNLSTGAILTTSGGITAVVTALRDGWYRISLTRDLLAGTSATFFTVYPNVYASYTANGTDSILVRRPQLESGSVATEYERIDAGFFPMDTAVTTSNVTVVAPRKNILTSTEALDNSVVWTRNNNPIITVNAAVAPNGTLTAEKIDASQGGNGVFAIGSVTSLVPHTFSVYIKDFSANSVLRIGPDARPPNGFIQLNANTGQITFTAANVISSSVVPAANGWYRASVTTTPTSLVTGPAYVVYAAGSGASSFLAWGAQLEVGNVATSYQRVDSALVLSENVADAGNTNPTITTQDPGAHRRNLLSNSQAFTTTSWGASASGTGVTPVIVANADTAPDGTRTAFRITFDKGTGTTSNDISLFASQLRPATTTTHTGSVWLRANTQSEVGKSLLLRHVGAASYLSMTLSNTWQRFSRAELGAGTTFTFDIALRGSISTDNQVSALVWGAQLESGPVATEYERIDASFFPQELAVTTSNVTIVAPRRNILNYTQNFNTPGWSTQNGTTLTNNTAVAPDGTLSADTALSPTATGSSGFSQAVSLALVPHTASLWLRAGNTTTGSFGVWNLTNSAWNTATPFMISGPGSIGGTTLMSVSGLSTTQWSRVGITFTPTVASNAFYFYPETHGTGNTGKTVQVWGAQLETGNVATSYQHVDVTTLALADNRPDAGNTNPTITTQDPGAHRRNRLTNTETLTTPHYAPWQGTMTQVAGPVWRLTPLATLERHYLYRGTEGIGFQTFSVELKADGYDFASIELSDLLNNYPTVVINLTNGALVQTPLLTATSEPLADGWYRIVVRWNTELTDATSRAFAIFMQTGTALGTQTFTGDPTKGLLIRKPQIERGPVATEYERIDSAFFPTETAVTSASANANLDYRTGSVRSMFYSTGNTVASAASARAENRERLVVQATNDKLDMYIINSGQVIERRTNTISISNTTSIVIGTSNAGIRVFANGVETLNNTAPIAFFYNQAGNTSVKSQYLPTGSIDSLERKLTFSSGLNGNASAVTLYYTGD